MDAGKNNEYRDLLDSKSRDELNIIAKGLKVTGVRRLSNDALIIAILDADTIAKVAKPNTPSWWNRHHNHVYGIATLAGLVLTVIFFVLQNPKINLSGSHEQIPSASLQSPGPSDNSRNSNTPVVSGETLVAPSSKPSKSEDAAANPRQSKPKKPELLLQMYGDDVSRFSLVSTGEGQFIVDHLYLALRGYADCALRNEGKHTIPLLGATSVLTAYALYISPSFAEYDLLPLGSPSDIGTWKYTGDDSDEFSIELDYPPYVLFMVSVEVQARDLRTNQVFHLSSQPSKLIAIRGDFGGCRDLERWYRPGLLKKPKPQSYTSEFSVLVRHLLIVDLYKNSSFLEKAGKNRLQRVLPQLNQASRKYRENAVFARNLRAVKEYLSGKSRRK